ncbi:HpcH/HpaI aldolase family protein [Marinivivus vitaminiproducens]|uniref:HpcH/HpaI aldolase family protein n=1 Tax=Marinivivus vitaminiproducens TaxID=3035935 RepID=UPI0027A8A3A1|nr:aldolase/citrate lyase family protein [Geminicoccaceae bacterium SCSIO 64248]
MAHSFTERPFRRRVRDGERLFGTFLKTPSTHAAEILGAVGYDFVVVDEEHAPLNPETTERILLACRLAGIAGVVRVARPEDILRVLDCGAAGVLVPHVDSPERAQHVAKLARYREGTRGFSNTTRAGAFGARGIAEHVAAQDEHIAVIAMIEDVAALAVIDGIAAVDGIDAFFIGRGDLTVAYGETSQASAPVRAALEAITGAAATANRRVFAMTGTAEDATELAMLGASGFIVASDQGFLRRGATDMLGLITDALGA